MDGVFDYCQNFEIAEWFLKSRTRRVDGYCFRRVDTLQHQHNLESIKLRIYSDGRILVCVRRLGPVFRAGEENVEIRVCVSPR